MRPAFALLTPRVCLGQRERRGCEARKRSWSSAKSKDGGSCGHSCIRRHNGRLCPAGGLGRGPRLQGENRIPLSPVGSWSPQLPWLRRWRPKTPPQRPPLKDPPNLLLLLIFSSLCSRMSHAHETLKRDERVQTYLVTGCSAV